MLHAEWGALKMKSIAHVPSILVSIDSWIGSSNICRCLQTSTTRLNFCWTSFVAPLYAVAVASAMTGENAIRKSSLRRALDCCATSVNSVSVKEKQHHGCAVVHTVCKINQVQPLVASRILEALKPQLTSSIRVSPRGRGVLELHLELGRASYRWNMTH